MEYDKDTFTYGCELEWGDISKSTKIPESLGKWEYCETDVLNLREPYKFIAADPLGIKPPMGGEINTKPTLGFGRQIIKIKLLRELFKENNEIPTASCIGNFHIHIHVPELAGDIRGLKRLIKYISKNQTDVIKATSNFKQQDFFRSLRVTPYFKFDGYREMPDYLIKNILSRSTDFDSFIKMHCAGKDGISMGRPFRYSINTYCLRHIQTIEFRCFRNTTNTWEQWNCFKFVEKFIDAALNNGDSVKEILSKDTYTFPAFNISEEEVRGWLSTKYDKSRGKKQRSYDKID